MIKCDRCGGTVVVDREYSSINHLEISCLHCGMRKFFHPPTESREGRWLLEKELLRAKHTITPL